MYFAVKNIHMARHVSLKSLMTSLRRKFLDGRGVFTKTQKFYLMLKYVKVLLTTLLYSVSFYLFVQYFVQSEVSLNRFNFLDYCLSLFCNLISSHFIFFLSLLLLYRPFILFLVYHFCFFLLVASLTLFIILPPLIPP